MRLFHPVILLLVLMSPTASAWAGGYAEAVLADNPVGYWRFEQDTDASTAANSAESGKTLDGTPFNVTFGVPGATPALGNAARFTASPDAPSYISLPGDPALQLRGDMTIEWWQYMSDNPAAEDQAIIAWASPGESASDNVLYEVVMRYSDEQKQRKDPRPQVVTGHEHGQGVNVRVASRTRVHPNRWYHVAVVRDTDARTIRYYVNGMPAGETQAYGEGHDNPRGGEDAGVCIGRLGRFDRRYFHGYLDEVAVYNHTLTEQRIMAHYRAATRSTDTAHKPRVVAHRGVHRYAPENTRVSYEQALDAGAPIVELDLHRSKDGVIVLLHDDTLERTTNGTGRVNDMTLKQLKALDAGSWKDARYAGEPIPTFLEIAELCKDKAIVMLDLKDPVRGDEIAPVIARTGTDPSQVIVAPWKTEQADDLTPYLPGVPMILLHSRLPEGHERGDAFFEDMKRMGFSGFSLNWTYLTQGFVDAARCQGMKVYTWTINNPEDISGAALMGVDGVITDDPAATAMFLSDVCD